MSDADCTPGREPRSVAASYVLFMAALRSRCGHYIFILWFLLSFVFFISSPNLSGRRLDVYHTSAHGVALVGQFESKFQGEGAVPLPTY